MHFDNNVMNFGLKKLNERKKIKREIKSSNDYGDD